MKLNRQQKFVIWIGTLLIVGMGIYPPWIESFDSTWYFDRMNSTLGRKIGPKPGGYHPIYRSPKAPRWIYNQEYAQQENLYWSFSIDTARLLIQWTIILLMVAALVWTFRD